MAKKNFPSAASPSARRLRGDARDKMVALQRRRWKRLAASFGKGELRRLAEGRLRHHGVAAQTADSDDWLAAAQSAYNSRAHLASRQMGTDRDW